MKNVKNRLTPLTMGVEV